MKLDVEAATRAVQRRLGRRLDLSVEQAACRVRRMADEGMAQEVGACVRQAGQNPAKVTLFSVGGAGPLHACNMAQIAGLKQVVMFPFGSVFSAFGGGTTDVQHLYRHTFSDGAVAAGQIGKVVEAIVEQARRDMQGEGFRPSDVPLVFEVGREGATVEGQASLEAAEFSKRILEKVDGASIDLLRACATSATPHWRQPPLATGPNVPTPRGRRAVWWSTDGPVTTAIYDRDALQPGARIDGPAIIEAPDTTYAVNPGWNLTVNELAFFIVSRNGTETVS
jgi:N-methylhydantoinase A/oxoprolinase/acetone carboxylase beta subunit